MQVTPRPRVPYKRALSEAAPIDSDRLLALLKTTGVSSTVLDSLHNQVSVIINTAVANPSLYNSKIQPQIGKVLSALAMKGSVSGVDPSAVALQLLSTYISKDVKPVEVVADKPNQVTVRTNFSQSRSLLNNHLDLLMVICHQTARGGAFAIPTGQKLAAQLDSAGEKVGTEGKGKAAMAALVVSFDSLVRRYAGTPIPFKAPAGYTAVLQITPASITKAERVFRAWGEKNIGMVPMSGSYTFELSVAKTAK